MVNRAELAIYPGTFDPITNGHLDIIKRGLKLFKRVIVAVSDNKNKNVLFSVDERVKMIREVCKDMDVEVDSFDGLLVDFLKKKKCNIVIRALRAVSDFEYEFQMAVVNKDLDPELETIFLMTNKEYFYLSSSVVKEISLAKGKVSNLVPGIVEKELMKKYD
ncbi:MAG: pantetheine-phosphate adenylyltransferase [Nanoarchaeota archaeon]